MKWFGLYAQVVLYVLAGINHFIRPNMYRSIVPHGLPWRDEIVWVSGAAEIICGGLLLFPATRIFGAWCIIALLIAVFPANIQMLVNFSKANNPNTWMAWLRLPVQALLIYWAFLYTRPTVF